MLSNGFPKTEHLVSRAAVERLFSQGSAGVTVYPLRAVFRQVQEETVPVRVLISVSKRHFKHAVDRNRAKRQVREAYRLQKHVLWEVLERKGMQLEVAFVWLSDEPQDSCKVMHAMQHLLQKILLKL